MKRRFLIEAYRGTVLLGGDLSRPERHPLPLVHDLAGLKVSKRIELLWAHKEVIGVLNHVEIGAAGVVAIATVDSSCGDVASRIIEEALTGKVFGASVQIKAVRSYFAAAGEARVNGQLLTEPAWVTSSGWLRDITICEVGADRTAFARILKS